jgi:hypothetical protein
MRRILVTGMSGRPARHEIDASRPLDDVVRRLIEIGEAATADR